ncbi:MAG: capsular exopolysaccharide synthesis family protein [Alphaproteobacteria bacterium]|jgi:capsular exopolysaccharide synthesis family protein
MPQKKISRFIANDMIDNSADRNIMKLDFSDLKKKGFINPTTRRALISEEIRLIKRRLFKKMALFEDYSEGNEASETIDNEKKNIDHVLQITSSKPNEGKSFTALNLALSIAMDERYNVLLIDADIRRSSLTTTLNLTNEIGLTDILRDTNIDLSSALKREKNYPLTFLPSGSGVASATDLFGGHKMKRLVHDVAHRYRDRIIIFDSPPLLAGTESVVLSHHVGQVLYVIDSSSTPYATIETGLDLLDNYDKVSLILNKTPKFTSNDQFGSYYEHYGKEYGEKSNE